MVLTYRFKKEKLDDGSYVSRPRILVDLQGIEVTALIDSGCDVTVIPENLAKEIGLNLNGKRDKLYAFREATEVICTNANIKFLGRAERQNVLINIPVLITPADDVDTEGIVLGIRGVFDNFEINFKKARNQIIMKEIK